ncbi:S1 RNA-binding domain-containing protein [Neofamilia massiliensis]|uniref:CvfB family protein n=1 Tax=Neofamilia massiliensis TaxID=1673724 RepID=UPI0006BB72B9|nr:S1-like domain-containing RNA-binding protein [Neofamilia massiliensis]
MIQIGQRQKLRVHHFTSEGAYLYDGKDPNTLALLEENLDKSIKKEDTVLAFVYKDKGRLWASRKKPYLELGQIGLLRVVAKTKIGAFMDLGLDKDVLLPFSETLGQVHEGQYYLVRLYLDKTNRLALTMKIKDYLEKSAPYKKDDLVEGTIYSIHKDHGIFIAVDEKYDSLVPKEEAKGIYQVGETLAAKVRSVNADGRLVLSFDNEAHFQIDEDAERLLDLLEDNDGILEIGDKSRPDEIKKLTGMSKSEFKRAAGKLYKEREIKIYPEKIVLI